MRSKFQTHRPAFHTPKVYFTPPGISQISKEIYFTENSRENRREFSSAVGEPEFLKETRFEPQSLQNEKDDRFCSRPFWSGLRVSEGETVRWTVYAEAPEQGKEYRAGGTTARDDYACEPSENPSSAKRNWFEPLPSEEKEKHFLRSAFFFGADYGARTRHLHLGKVALYQMS